MLKDGRMDKKGEMEKVAGVFDLYQLPKTAKVIRDLSNDLYVIRKKIDFEKVFEQIQEVLKVEFISNGGTDASFRKKLYSAYIQLVNSAGKADLALVKKQTEDYASSIQRIYNSYGVIGDVSKSFLENKQRTTKQHYYAECFGYLLITEGVFRELCEYIIMLNDISKGRLRSFSQLELLSLADLVKEIRSKMDISVLTHGYDNYLRNAIAHTNFRFDETTQKMTFTNEYKGKATSIALKIEEFGEYYLKIDDLYRLVSSIWMLGRLVITYRAE
jgi:hypothetical protein